MPTTTIDLAALTAAQGFRLAGAGYAVAPAGDVNGDGLGDVVLGSASAGPFGRAAAGEAYVLYGRLGGYGAPLDLAGLDRSQGFRIAGAAAGYATGFSAAGAGDQNGDGLADLIVGAFKADPDGRTDVGAAYVVYGFDAAGTPATGAPTPGPDALLGTAGADALDALAGDDTLLGLVGDDALDGGAGNDALDGGEGADGLTGGAGDDAYFVDDAGDRVVEAPGEGSDVVFSSIDVTSTVVEAYAGVEYVVLAGPALNAAGSTRGDGLFGNAGGNALHGLGGDDYLSGEDGDDALDGGEGADGVVGGAGADGLLGGLGADTLLGGAGADTLAGGAGTDALIGGAGADLYAFGADAIAGGPYDVVLGFDPAEGDRVRLDPSAQGRVVVNTDAGNTYLGVETSPGQFYVIAFGGTTDAAGVLGSVLYG